MEKYKNRALSCRVCSELKITQVIDVDVLLISRCQNKLNDLSY